MSHAPADGRAPILGILLMTGGFLLIPASDGLAKLIVNDYHVVQIVWGRMFFQTLVVAAVVLPPRPLARLRTRRLRLQLTAAAMAWLSHYPFYIALAFLPLAGVFALTLIAPLMVTALSVVFLAERVGIHRWTAVAIGFAGAMIIVRPGLGVVHWAAFFPLLAAAFFALYQIAVRSLGASDDVRTTLFYASAVGALISSLLVPFFWTPPTPLAWLVLVLMGCSAGLIHFAIIKALELAPASLLAPFAYVQLVSSAVVGLVGFGEFPDRWTVIGALVIAGAGLYVATRERRARARRAAP